MVENAGNNGTCHCLGRYIDELPEKSGILHTEWDGRLVEIFGHETGENGSKHSVPPEVKKAFPIEFKCIQEPLPDGSIKIRILEIISQ